jgi:hypothetical protein
LEKEGLQMGKHLLFKRKLVRRLQIQYKNQVVFHEVLQKKLSIPLLKNTILALMN